MNLKDKIKEFIKQYEYIIKWTHDMDYCNERDKHNLKLFKEIIEEQEHKIKELKTKEKN